MESNRNMPPLSTDRPIDGLREGFSDSSDSQDESSGSIIGSIEFSLSSLSSFAASEPRGNNSNHCYPYSPQSSNNGSILGNYPILQFGGSFDNTMSGRDVTGINFVHDSPNVTDENIHRMKQKMMDHFDMMQAIDLTRDSAGLPDILQNIYMFNRDYLGFNLDGITKSRHISDAFTFLASQRATEESQRNLVIAAWMRVLHNDNIMALSEASYFVFQDSSPLTKENVPAAFSAFIQLFID
ncbi:hypothetical protein CAEBREN_11855 [Caenorhabditis brenneri]|uniref:Uncharacterized protein n=1 Tax=Caenorhabditis brenneri TaxID=135651 RepID=G0MX74_CAEBE|nr:hypothetical protein CAEBREN_11855 [Caenorhabditis brenneri]